MRNLLDDRGDHPLPSGQELEQRFSGLVLDLEIYLPAVSPEPPLCEMAIPGQVYGFFEGLAQSLDGDSVLDELLHEEQIHEIHEGGISRPESSASAHERRLPAAALRCARPRRVGVLIPLEPAPDPAGVQAHQTGRHSLGVHRHVQRFDVGVHDLTLPSSAGARATPTTGSAAQLRPAG